MKAREQSKQDWHDAVAELVLHIDDERLPYHATKFLSQMVSLDSSIMLLFNRDYKPHLLYENLTHPWRDNRIDTYLSTAYLVDPFYITAMEDIGAGLYGLQQLAPNGFYEGEYFKTYYLHSHVSDELAYLIPIDDGSCFCLSIQRKLENPPFSEKELATLHRCTSIIRSVVLKYWQHHSASLTQSEEHRIGAALQRALRKFGESVLTPRECDVLRLMLRGHSTRSSADKLEISPGTVKIHREKIYSKLDISSQTELFHLFIDAASSIDYEYRGDPLETYLSKHQR
jgi:DNA-binding CsgD family transcriptional regulator